MHPKTFACVAMISFLTGSIIYFTRWRVAIQFHMRDAAAFIFTTDNNRTSLALVLHNRSEKNPGLVLKTVDGHSRRTNSLAASPRVLCLVVHDARNQDRAKAVLQTWIRRCNDFAFISTAKHLGTPTVLINKTESRNHLWAKVQALLRYSYSKLNDFEWFLKTDDDTYVIMENLRLFLSNYSSNDPVYFGTEFKPVLSIHPPTGFLSGGAGYVLSRKSISLLIEKGFDTGLCDLADHEIEEVKLENCATKVGVHHDGNTLDDAGRARFLPYYPTRHMTPGNEDLGGWLRHRLPSYQNCCSPTAISFHYVTPMDMYLMDYLVYILKPHRA